MKLLLKGYDEEETIDIFEMCNKIDDIFHTHITNINRYTISHDTIHNFVLTIVNEINKDIQLRRNELDEFDARERAESIEIKRQIECGRVVTNLDTLINRIKYEYMGYVLDADNGGILYNFQP